MTVLSWDEFRTGSTELPIAATIGVFDGIHRGHRALLESVLAHASGRLSTVFTFAENPKKILRPESYRGDVMTLAQRLDLLRSLGISIVVLIDFSGNFGKLSGSDFLGVLEDAGRIEYLAVGMNFRCGYRLDTDAPRIRTILSNRGATVDIVEQVRVGDSLVSSSRIRDCILGGRLGEAAALLGRPYSLDLRDSTAATGEIPRRMRKAGFTQVLPPEGTYRVHVAGPTGSAGGPVAVTCRITTDWIEFDGGSNVDALIFDI